MTIYIKKQNLLYGGVLASIAIIFAIFSWSTPFMIDDLQFMGAYRTYSEGTDSFSLSAWIGYIHEIRTYDNSRLCNMLSPFSTIIQPWCTIFPVLTGLCTAALIALIISLIGVKRQQWLYTIVLWGLMMAFLPWRDSIIVRDYLLNYIYGATITLFALYLLLKYEQKGWTYARFVICLLLYVIAGAWHEGFAVSMIVGMFLYAVYKHKTISQQWWILTFFYGIIALLFLFSPGMLNRANNIVGTAPNYLRGVLLSLVPVYALAISLLAMFVIPSGLKSLRELTRNPVWFISLVACAIWCVLIIFFQPTSRMALFPDILAFIILFITFKDSVAGLFDRRWIKLIVCMGYILLIGQAIIIIQCLRIIKRDAEYIEVTSRDSYFMFYDFIQPESVPMLTMYLPPRYALLEPFHYLTLKNAHLQHTIPSVVPTALQDADTTNSRALTDGNLDLYIHEGLLWSTHEMTPYQSMSVRTPEGIIENVNTVSRFLNQQGDTCYYIYIKKFDTSQCLGIDVEDDDPSQRPPWYAYSWDEN